MRVFSVYVELGEKAHLYTGVIPSVSGAHSQGATLDELQSNMQKVLALCLQEQGHETGSHFVGLQQVEIAV